MSSLAYKKRLFSYTINTTKDFYKLSVNLEHTKLFLCPNFISEEIFESHAQFLNLINTGSYRISFRKRENQLLLNFSKQEEILFIIIGYIIIIKRTGR